jgi:hypothetical protein
VRNKTLEEFRALVTQAFLSAAIANHYQPPPATWEGEADGVRFRGGNKGGKVTWLEIVDPTPPQK